MIRSNSLSASNGNEVSSSLYALLSNRVGVPDGVVTIIMNVALVSPRLCSAVLQ